LSVASNLCEVAHSSKKPIGDTGCAACTPCDLRCPALVDADAENVCRAGNDGLQFVIVVVIESSNQSEPISKGAGDEPGPSCRTNEGESREVESNRTSGGAFAQHDVELKIFHRWVQHLFDIPAEAMDLVDEKHIAFAEASEDRGEISGTVESWTGGDVECDLEFSGDDARQRGLAEARRSREEQMIHGLLATSSSFKDDAKVLLEFPLSDKVIEMTGTKSTLFANDIGPCGMVNQF
jgi:hypothetical protein